MTPRPPCSVEEFLRQPWTSLPENQNFVETMSYVGHVFRVRHAPGLELGYVDGRFAASDANFESLVRKLWEKIPMVEK